MNRYKLMRYERGLTAQDVVRATGIAHQTLKGVESGGRVAPHVAKRLADFYEMTVAELLGVTDTDAAA